jgi:hypothetical protein
LSCYLEFVGNTTLAYAQVEQVSGDLLQPLVRHVVCAMQVDQQATGIIANVDSATGWCFLRQVACGHVTTGTGPDDYLVFRDGGSNGWNVDYLGASNELVSSGTAGQCGTTALASFRSADNNSIWIIYQLTGSATMPRLTTRLLARGLSGITIVIWFPARQVTGWWFGAVGTVLLESSDLQLEGFNLRLLQCQLFTHHEDKVNELAFW